jgi:nucleoside-diphosphate-sugar epimerase
MNILVTGSSGRIGQYVVRELINAGHRVIGADIAPPQVGAGEHINMDLTSAGEVYQVLARSQANAVVHLGAWSDAGLAADTRVYDDNVTGTFNLLQACADLGIQRVVSASSAQVYGFQGAPPISVPVGESHPVRPVNCYALGKVASEDAAEYFTNRYGLTILSFRFMGVRAPADIAHEIERMAADPASGSWLLWTRTDARDAATACRLAIEAEAVAPGPYNITGPQVVLPVETSELIQTYFGSATEVTQPIPGYTSPLSIDKAHAEFGYDPSFIWRLNQYHPEE